VGRMTDRPDSGPVVFVYTTGSVMPIEIAAEAGDRELIFVAPEPETPAELRATLGAIGTLVDAADEDAIVAALSAAAPAGIVAFSDRDLPLTARLAARLGLRYHSQDAALAAVSKLEQRTRLRAAGLRVPRFRLVSSVGELADAVAAVRVPAVLKPVRGVGSRDTYRVDSLADAVEQAGPPLASGQVDAFVLEEMLVGDPAIAGPDLDVSVSVEQLWWAERPAYAMVASRLPTRPPFRETGFFLPARLDRGVGQQVIDVATAACRALGLADGWTHTEIMLTADGPTVLEVNARIGGYRAVMLYGACGLETISLALDVAAGIAPKVPERAPSAVAYAYWVLPPMGDYYLESWGGFEELAALPCVRSVMLISEPGERVDWRAGAFGILGVIEGTAASPDEVLAAVREFERRLAEDVVFRPA